MEKTERHPQIAVRPNDKDRLNNIAAVENRSQIMQFREIIDWYCTQKGYDLETGRPTIQG